MEPIHKFQKDQLFGRVFADREQMGAAAAADVIKRLRDLLEQKETVNMMFAAAPSQRDFLQSLTSQEGIDWTRVQAFHLDEYVGLPPDAPQRFGTFLDEHIFKKVPFQNVHYIDVGAGAALETILADYSQLLREHPLDMACIGIGENGHIAFNDPHVANFADPEIIKVVDLDMTCRNQQVNDGCFDTLDAVPQQAYTVTIPTILSADYIYCMVPAATKQAAVTAAVKGDIELACPASVLRTHQRCQLYVDAEAGAGLL